MRSLLHAAWLFLLAPTLAQAQAQEPPPQVDAQDNLPPPPLGPVEVIDNTPPPPLGIGVVRLHLLGGEMFLKRDSGPPVRVFDDKGMHLVMGVVCKAPCDAIVDARGNDFVLGGGFTVPDSFSFNLKNESGDLTIRTSPGNYLLRTVGVLLSGVGGYVMYFGLELALVQATVGVAALGAGAVLVSAGVVMMVLSRTTYQLSHDTTTVISQ